MTEPTVTEVTLKDVWRLLEDMDRSMSERFDRIERRFTAKASGFDSGICAPPDALTPKVDESPR
jgi:hypothetical protein